MRAPRNSFVLGSLLAAILLTCASRAHGDAPLDEALIAVDRVEESLRTASNGGEWRAYLKIDELRKLLSADGTTNQPALRDILLRFRAESSYLDHPEFAALRRILERRLGEPSIPTLDELPQAIQEAKTTFVAADPEALKAAEGDVRAAFQALDKYLLPSNQRPGWRKHLLLEGIDTNEPASIDVARLERVRRQLHNRHGRKLTPSARLQNAIRNYQRLRLARDAEQAEFATVLDRLAAAIGGYGQALNDAAQSKDDPQDRTAERRLVSALRVGDELAWLESHGQAKPVVDAVRRHWARPNLFGHTSEYLVSKGMERSVAETNPIHENILGTDVHGTGTTYGSTLAQLVPSTAYATIDLISSGTTYSNTVGYNSGASIFSTGTSQFAARKRMFLTGESTYFWGAAVNVCTHSNPNCVSSGRGHGGFITRIADRVAWNRVMQSVGAAEEESSRIAAGKIKGRMDQEAVKRSAESRENFDKKYRLALLDADAYPSLFRYSTTNKYLQMTQLQARSFELGAPNSPPAFVPEGDFAVQMHESMLENYFRARYGDVNMTEEGFRSESLLFMTKEEYEERYDPNSSNTVKLDKDQPVVVKFRKGADGRDGYSVNVLGFFGTPGGSSRAEVGVEYDFDRNADGFVIARRKRRPNPDVVPDPNETPQEEQDRKLYESFTLRLIPKNKTKETGMGLTVRRMFDKMFEEEQKFDPLVFKGELSKAGKLRLIQYLTNDGWMVLTWKKPVTLGPNPQPPR